MKTLLFLSILFSALFSAQIKNLEPLIPSDEIKPHVNAQQTSMAKPLSVYKMLIAKPKESYMYMALKQLEKDLSKYNILNVLTSPALIKELKK